MLSSPALDGLPVRWNDTDYRSAWQAVRMPRYRPRGSRDEGSTLLIAATLPTPSDDSPQVAKPAVTTAASSAASVTFLLHSVRQAIYLSPGKGLRDAAEPERRADRAQIRARPRREAAQRRVRHTDR